MRLTIRWLAAAAAMLLALAGCSGDGSSDPTLGLDGNGGFDVPVEEDTLAEVRPTETEDAPLPGDEGGDGIAPACKTDDDCLAYDDGDLCNGLWSCQDGQCHPAPDSAVVCPEETPCSHFECAAETGECLATIVADYTACDDGSACTAGDVCLDGQCAGEGLLCDDQDPCTQDSCDPAQGCVTVPSEGPCEDGNPCTENDYCEGGICQPGQKAGCNDDNPCTDDGCSSVEGCIHQFNSIACDDGNICTIGDMCVQGKCLPGVAVDCSCAADEECAKFDDGNHCNGKVGCVEGTCVLIPGSEVVCADADPSDCTLFECYPKTGECVAAFAEDGTECDDGDPCTGEASCLDGKCVGKEGDCDDDLCTYNDCDPAAGGCTVVGLVNCGDYDYCTIDTCDPVVGCINTCDHAACGDCEGACDPGGACWVGWLFDPLDGCVYEAVDCDDGNPCTLDSCNPDTPEGDDPCVHEPDPAADDELCKEPCFGKADGECDDGDCCTTDSCSFEVGSEIGHCVHEEEPVPSTPCLLFACDPATCEPVGKPLDCSDGFACTDDSCDPQTGLCGNVPKNCDDGNPDTVDECDVMTGECLHIPKDCDDNSPCTVSSIDPATGQCLLAPKCVDGSLCTADICDPATGACSFPQKCDDNNKCTVDSCNGQNGECSYSPVNCSDNDPNTYDTCDPLSGCLNQPVECDDGDPCTAAKVDPATGQCVTVPLDCNDQNACTIDMCDPATGCVNSVVPCECEDPCGNCACDPKTGKCGTDPLGCDDGNPCTQDLCNPLTGLCFSSPITCSDKNPCTTDWCDKGVGCVAAPKDCDDKNPCTVDSCDPLSDNGTCLHALIDCKDDKICTSDYCDPQSGKCQHEVKTCNDDDPCTDDHCSLVTGDCIHIIKTCSDKNPCTDDACDPVTGACSSTPKSCDDQNKCTEDSCDLQTGECKHKGQNCDDGDICTADIPLQEDCGCLHNPITCDDKNICTADTCNQQSGCLFTPIVCDDKDLCTQDSCDPTVGCVYVPIVCDDGNFCTSDFCDKQTGQCTSKPVVCNDNNACTKDLCDQATGACLYPPKCVDSDPCTLDSCFMDTGACSTTPVVCNDGNQCTKDSCNSQTGGCVYDAKAMDGAACEDGNDCTSPDKCASGKCETGPVVCKEICNNSKDDDLDQLIDCLDPDCKENPACLPTCQLDGTVKCGSTVQGVTSGNVAGVLDKYSCTSGSYPKDEAIYEYTAECTGQITVLVTAKSGPLPLIPTLDALVLDASLGCKATSCIAAGLMAGDLGIATVKFNATKGKKYYLVVDGRNGQTGSFALTVSCMCIVPDKELICNNNVDDDSDGLVDCKDPDCASNPLCAIQQCVIDSKTTCGSFISSSIDSAFGGQFATYSCSNFAYPGDERIYTFVSTCTGQAQVVLSTGNVNEPGPNDPPIKLGPIDLLILDGQEVCSSTKCLAAGLMEMQGPIPGAGTAIASFKVEANHKYYIVADGRAGSGGAFTMLVNCFCILPMD